MTKHTPGPWRTNDGHPAPIIWADDPRHGGIEVARASTWGGDGMDEIGHNARLIAAAPDLLWELRYALRVMEGAYDDPSGLADLARCIESAREAIAKAEGEEEP